MSPSRTADAPAARASRRLLAVLVALLALALGGSSTGCDAPEGRPLAPRTQTFAELRVVRRGVTVEVPGEDARPPYPRERLVDGAIVEVAAGGLAWVRRDGGATLLLAGPSRVRALRDAVQIERGRVFVDAPGAEPTRLVTGAGPVELARVRASVEADERGARIYVLDGEVRAAVEQDGRVAASTARAGEELDLAAGDPPRHRVTRVVAWDDWTGGLATTDRAAAPPPFGVGTVGARPAGDLGAPRAPLVIQSLDVSIVVDGDFATTEVEQRFFNPASEVVEGIYRMRLPDGASLERFGVDRLGAIAWGYVKEKAQAAAQYQANVYQGSTEDPALLQWIEPGVYEAKLYPLGPGASRRVVARWTEHLPRGGARGERRMVVFPMAAEGAEGSLPLVEELTVTVDVTRAGAREVRAGMDGTRVGDTIVVRRQDFVPRADLAIELLDDGVAAARAGRAPHRLDAAALAPADRARAAQLAAGEADYVVVPVRPDAVKEPEGGLDVAIVIDTSAATDEVELALARGAARSLLAHLGPGDRVAVLAADDRLRAAGPGTDALAAADDERRRAIDAAIARLAPGGATDLGAVLADAASRLDPARRSIVVYVGDGAPTVGERSLADLRARLAKVARPARTFALATGDAADLALLDGVAQGGFAARVTDGASAARAALRVLEAAERPALLRATVDLGPGVERVYPRDLSALSGDEAILLVGRVVGPLPEAAIVRSPAGEVRMPLEVRTFADRGDLRRRWAEARLADMLEEGTGRAALVDLGVRQGIVTPVTSFYVPTTAEMTPAEVADLRARAAAGELAHRQERQRSVRQLAAAAPADDAAVVDGEASRRGKEDGSEGDQADAKEEKAEDEGGFLDGLFGGAKGDAAPSPVAAAAPPPAQAAEAEIVAAQPQVAASAPGGGAHAAPSAPPTGPAGDPLAGGEPLGNTPSPAPTAARDASPPPPPGFGSGVGRLGGAGRAPPGDAEKRPAPPSGASGGEAPVEPPTSGLAAPAKPAPPAPRRARAVNREVAVEAEDRLEAKNALDPAGSIAVDVTIAIDGRRLRHRLGCSRAADAPLADRLVLWRERLLRAGSVPHAVATVYRSALATCEAPGLRERALLVGAMLDVLPTPSLRVALWRELHRDLGAGDLLYRGLLARVRTADEARELARALGLRSAPPGAIAEANRAKDAAERVAKLRALRAAWPDDHDVALLLLDALEDALEPEGARALGRELRRRPDVDARVRTAVGELHLRLAAAATDPARRADDEGEARRAFGEIVEFAPEDPAARRRLGDLLRSHGWFEEAARQYETLAALVPDDPGVALLRASAAEGLGKLEEAVRWADQAASSGPPGAASGPAATARALAATFLARGQIAAREAGDAEAERRLGARKARYLRASGPGEGPRARVALVWSHPDVHPSLWSDALGPPLPATEGDPALGVLQIDAAARRGGWFEIRVDPAEQERAARLGATLDLLVAVDEGGEGERLVRRRVKLERGGPARLRFAMDSGEPLPLPAETAEASR